MSSAISSEGLSPDDLLYPSRFAEKILGHKPYDYQSRFLDCKDRFVIFRAGRKCGKTFCSAVKALHTALLNENATVLIIAPTQRQSMIMFGEVRRLIEKNPFFGFYITRCTQTMMFFGNGSAIYAIPAGRTGYTVRGFTPKLIIVDESAYVPDEVLRAVLPSLLGQAGNIIMVGTPFGKRGYFYDAAISGRWTEIFAKSYDNPTVKADPLFLEEIKTLTKDEFKQEVEAEFLEETDNFFSRELILSCVEENMPEEATERFLGVDIARYGVDSTVFTVVSQHQGKAYVNNIEEITQAPITDVVGRIKEKHNQWYFTNIFVDETGLGAGAYDMLRQTNIPVEGITFTIQRKEEIYQNLKLLMEQKRLRLPADKKLLNQMASLKKQYSMSGNMRIFSEGHEDYCDSLALACFGVPASSKARTLILEAGNLF